MSRTPHCTHCKKLGVWPRDHFVCDCPVLARTRCRKCHELGHTAKYCEESKWWCRYGDNCYYIDDGCEFWHPRDEAEAAAGAGTEPAAVAAPAVTTEDSEWTEVRPRSSARDQPPSYASVARAATRAPAAPAVPAVPAARTTANQTRSWADEDDDLTEMVAAAAAAAAAGAGAAPAGAGASAGAGGASTATAPAARAAASAAAAAGAAPAVAGAAGGASGGGAGGAGGADAPAGGADAPAGGADAPAGGADAPAGGADADQSIGVVLVEAPPQWVTNMHAAIFRVALWHAVDVSPETIERVIAGIIGSVHEHDNNSVINIAINAAFTALKDTPEKVSSMVQIIMKVVNARADV